MDFEVNGYRMHYELFGDPAGEPLLWLHGWSGTGQDWKFIFKDPPAGFRLIGPDVRGNGASTGFEGTHSFRQSARDILALLDHLGVRRVKAIGLSGGAITLLHVATQQPDRIGAMIVISAPPYFPDQARAIQRQFSFESLPDLERKAMRERSKGGQEQLDWLTEQTRAMADTTDDVQFAPAVLRTIAARTLIVLAMPILCIRLASPLSCAKRFPARRFGWHQMVAMVQCSDLMRPDSLKRQLNFCATTGRKNKTGVIRKAFGDRRRTPRVRVPRRSPFR